MKLESRGFTLIELLIAIVIIAILAAVAIPSYRSYVIKSRRSDAITELLQIQSLQARWRANHPTFGTLADLAVVSTSPSGYYTLAISGVSALAYTATATVVSPGLQASDSGCAAFTLTQDGAVLDTAAKRTCWNQ